MSEIKRVGEVIGEMVANGTKKFNSLLVAPIAYAEFNRTMGTVVAKAFRENTYWTCIQHPDWDERQILSEVCYNLTGEKIQPPD